MKSPIGTIAVCTPVHLGRLHSPLFSRALGSVAAQSMPPDALSVTIDVNQEGAAPTRQRALMATQTDWVAFLDSDDMFYPDHLKLLADHAAETDADYVYSYWDTKLTPDILGHFGRTFDPANPTETTTTILVRADLAKEVGFQALPERQHNSGEDYRFTVECVKQGAKIVHLPVMTWHWAHHFGNTSGLPTKGDAVL